MAKKTGTAMVKWEEEMAADAKAMSATEKASGGRPWITHEDGQMKFKGEDIPDNELSVIILGVLHENQYYSKPFKRGESQIPDCFAFGIEEDEMEPHEKAEDKQHDACEGCPLNEWGSDPNGGDGKACKNVRRFAMISSSDLDDIENAEVAYMKLPVTSVKHWKAYFKKLEGGGRTYFGVATKLALDGKVFTFTLDKDVELSGEQYRELKARHAVIMEELPFPYEPLPETAKKTKPAKKDKNDKTRKGFGRR